MPATLSVGQFLSSRRLAAHYPLLLTRSGPVSGQASLLRPRMLRLILLLIFMCLRLGLKSLPLATLAPLDALLAAAAVQQ